MVVARQCFVTNGFVFEALRVSDANVRLLKEFNALLGQLIGLGTYLFEPVLRFGGSCLAPRTNLVVGRADVVCDERRQRRVYNLGVVEFVLGVIASRCRLVDSCVRRADHRAVPLDFGFVSHVQVPTVRLASLRTLKPHGVVARPVFAINAEFNVVFLFCPRNGFPLSGRQLVHLGVRPIRKSILVLAKNKVR